MTVDSPTPRGRGVVTARCPPGEPPRGAHGRAEGPAVATQGRPGPCVPLLGHLPVSGPGAWSGLAHGSLPWSAARGRAGLLTALSDRPFGVAAVDPTSPGQEGDGSATGSRAVTPSPPFGVAQPCLPRSRGPGQASSSSGAEAGGPRGSCGRRLRRSGRGFAVSLAALRRPSRVPSRGVRPWRRASRGLPALP